MTKYEIFIKMLHDGGHVKAMQHAKQVTPELPGMNEEMQKQLDKACIIRSISTAMKLNPPLVKAFKEAADEMMIDRVITDLDLKKDPNFKRSPQDDFIVGLVNMIAGATGLDLEKLFKSLK